MKKIIVTLMTITMCMSFLSCGKSEAAKACDALIKNIGTVTLESENSIIEAEQAYEKLSQEEKEQIKKSAQQLSNSRNEYNQLVLEEKVNAVVTLIDAIGEVTLESNSSIVKAENAYGKLSEEEKEHMKEKAQMLNDSRNIYEQLVLEKKLNEVIALIDEIGELTLDSKSAIVRAENAYKKLSKEEKEMIKDGGEKLFSIREDFDSMVMKENSSKVINSINAIGTVTLNSKDKIENAKKLYNALSLKEKSMVTNYNTLESAEKKLNSLLAKEKERIINSYKSKFNIQEDKVEKMTWYIPKNMPKYANTRCYITPYIGVKGNYVWICVRYNYTEDDWIFWDKLIIVTDDNRYERNVDYFEITRDNGGGDVCEQYDEILNGNLAPTSYELQMLKDIADSKEAIVRFKGDDYQYDYTVSKTDKTMISDVLTFYGALIS